jgi:hypothetical protein
MILLSLDALANTVGVCADHDTWRTSSVWDSNTCSLRAGERISCRTAVWTLGGERERRGREGRRGGYFVGGTGDEEVLACGAECHGEDFLLVCADFGHGFCWGSCIPPANRGDGVRVRQCRMACTYSMSILSSPTLARKPSFVACQSTS